MSAFHPISQLKSCHSKLEKGNTQSMYIILSDQKSLAQNNFFDGMGEIFSHLFWTHFRINYIPTNLYSMTEETLGEIRNQT